MTRSICFVGTDSYPVLNHELKGEYFGGEAVQQTILAKAFRDFGYKVSMVCLDYGQPQGEIRENIRIFKTFKQNSGIPILRFLYPRLSSVIAAMKLADADVYFQSCAGANTGFVARFCATHSKLFVFRIASDSDCEPGSQIIRFYRDRKLYEYGLRGANIVSAQSLHQQSLLERNYSVKSHVVNMASEMPSLTQAVVPDIDVLWVSNIRACKNPEDFLVLASAFPDRKFTMIGGIMAGEEALFRKIQHAAASTPNLDFMGSVHYHDIEKFFARAKLLVNTSDIEGFPNTFLQAWAHRIPVVSFFDPDNLIEKNGLGFSPSNFEEMKSSVSQLLNSNVKRLAIGDTSFKFVVSNYSSRAVVSEYDRLITLMNYEQQEAIADSADRRTSNL